MTKQNHPKIIEMVKKYNLSESEFNLRTDGRVEWVCKHGVGHTVFGEGTHGCDGCCNKLKQRSKR